MTAHLNVQNKNKRENEFLVQNYGLEKRSNYNVGNRLGNTLYV